MAVFELTLAHPDGSEPTFTYDTANSKISGVRLDLGVFGRVSAEDERSQAVVVSPKAPGSKSRSARRVKVSLGLACNRSCTYCNQSVERAGADTSRLSDAEEFLRGLGDWWDGGSDGRGGGTRFEFWGGEPLLYWHKIRLLAEHIRTEWPNVGFSLISNGDLFDDEKISWLDKMGFSVGVSHDGPGQHLRGGDPLDDPRQRAAIRQLMDTLAPQGRFSFNCVLTAQHHSLQAVEAWICERLGVESVPLVTEGLMLPYDVSGMMLSPKGDDHDVIYQTLLAEMIAGDAYRNATIWDASRDFVASIAAGRSILGVGQKCGMDRTDSISVNLKGEVFTCQNTGTTEHFMGTVSDIDNVRLTRATHHSLRQECRTCPVVHLCRGACMFLEDDYFRQACDNSFTYFSAMMAGALYHLSGGGVLTEIKRPGGGEIRQQAA